MGRFPQTFIDDLRLQANILQVVQDYVPLKKAGVNYKGLCPFHSERSPSFQVNPDKGYFHCFGCGAGGDVFKFLELHEKVGFQDAVRMLAHRFGVALPEASDDDEETRRDAGVREALLKMHELAAAYFQEHLSGPAGGRARHQLDARSVSAATIEQLGLGYAPASRDGLKTRLARQGFSAQLLLQSGLVVQRDSGEVIDRFRNRLMIPICRDTGSIVAFGGRAMDGDQVPKYLNSPETAIYSKGRTLYGLHLTKAGIRKLGYVVLVEGYFDFAQVYQSNAAPVVASCGTALTSPQAHLLGRFTKKVVLSYDPDAAGEGAAAKSSELLVREGFDVNVVELDRGEDPDMFIRKKGGDAYRGRLRASRPYLEYLLDRAGRDVNFRDREAQRTFLGKMLAIAAWLPEAAARDQFADKVAHRANITAEVVQNEFRKLAAKRQTGLAPRELPGLGDVRKVEKALIWWLINRPAEAMPTVTALGEDDVQQLVTQRILQVARSLHAEPPDRVPAALIQRLNEGDAQLVTSIASEDAAPANSLAQCVSAVRRVRLERQLAEVQRSIQQLLQGQGWTDADLNALLRAKDVLGQELKVLIEE